MKSTTFCELHTPRLRLRKLSVADAPQAFANWTGDPEVAQYVTWQAHTDISQTEGFMKFCEDSYATPMGQYRWGIELKETGALVGSIDVVDTDLDLPSAVIGYCLSRACWNKGLMTEAVKAVNTYLLTEAGFARVEAYHHVENPASGRVMQKSGMIFEGIRRCGNRDNKGELCDVAVYAIVRGDLE